MFEFLNFNLNKKDNTFQIALAAPEPNSSPKPDRLYSLRMNVELNRIYQINGKSSIKLNVDDYYISKIVSIHGFKFKNRIRYNYDKCDETLTLRSKDVRISNFDIEIVYTSLIKDDFIKRHGDNFSEISNI